MKECTEKNDIRSLTIEALAGAKTPLEQFQTIFSEASDAFESGEDSQGWTIMQDTSPLVFQYFQFCATMLAECNELIPQFLSDELVGACSKFEELLGTMLDEVEAGNLCEVASVLRHDVSPLLGKHIDILGRIADHLAK